MRHKIAFICLSCGLESAKWAGRCSGCGQWNTISEKEREATESNSSPAEVTSFKEFPTGKIKRLRTKVSEFDRVLGSNDPGIVPGTVTLISGSPGVGKSTLLLQVASGVEKAVYFSAEESLEQLRLRGERLGLSQSSLQLSAQRDLGRILAAVNKIQPSLVVIDSIQTLFDETVAGTPGSLVQVREICWRIQQMAKNTDVAFLVVGHVTKEGIIAGPKVMEHLVDVVLYLEGERQTGLRVLRCEKNRYGPTDEVGIWNLESAGFTTVDDPGKLFASLIGDDVPGRALTVAVEGSRAFLVEVQALTARTTFGYPKRTSQGIELNRLNVILAVLENRLGVPMSQYDVFLNVVGGFQVKDPGVDLAIAGALLSSYHKKAPPDKLILLGEVGLLGEIRPPLLLERRQKEAKRLGYQTWETSGTLQKLHQSFLK